MFLKLFKFLLINGPAKNRTWVLSTSRTCSTIRLQDLKPYKIVLGIFKNFVFVILSMAKKLGMIIFLVYMVFGLFFINYQLNFIKIPEFISIIEGWVIFVGGLLIFLGGINYFRASKKSH